MHKIAVIVLLAFAASATACSHRGVELTDAVEDTTPFTEEAIIDAIKEEPIAEAKKYELESPDDGLLPEEETAAVALPKVIAEVPASEPEEAAVEEATPRWQVGQAIADAFAGVRKPLGEGAERLVELRFQLLAQVPRQPRHAAAAGNGDLHRAAFDPRR